MASTLFSELLEFNYLKYFSVDFCDYWFSWRDRVHYSNPDKMVKEGLSQQLIEYFNILLAD
jgi:hypothetical protein